MKAPRKLGSADALADELCRGEGNGLALEDALNVLTAVDEAGLVLVPREPTAEMLVAAANAAGVEPPAAYKAWRAMLGTTE